jgi:serine protease Do
VNVEQSSVAWAAAVLLGCCLPGLSPTGETPSNAQAPTDLASLKQLERRVQAAAKKVIPAVVAVEGALKQNVPGPRHHEPFASGVMITADGLILSQYHVSHLLDQSDPLKSRKPGERLKVILHDGRRLDAELLGADRAWDLSLLRLLDRGPYLHTPLDEKVISNLGDWVVKVGHPLGYRRGRAPVVRLGRVLCRTGDSLVADCLVTGGDSGGPLFDLDGRLVGIVRNSGIPQTLHAVRLETPRTEILFAYSTNALIHSRLDAMKQGKFGPANEGTMRTSMRQFEQAKVLPGGRWTQGKVVRSAYRDVVKQTRPSLVAVQEAGETVALGMVVGADGWVVTKASQLPAEPTCRLPGGNVVKAEVVGIDPAFDLALLKIAAKDLRPVEWAETPDTTAGTFLATVGSKELPVAVGVVSVPRRDLAGPYPRQVEPPRKRLASPPEVIGSAVQGRGYWVEFVEGKAAEAGVRPGDVILTIAGKEVRRHTDLAECVRGRRAGERVPVCVNRAGKTLDLTLRLRAEGDSATMNRRDDDFPTVFEHDVPLAAHELGGPVVDLSGKVVGVSIARVGPHGCMAIPGDCVRRLLPELKSGKLAAHWTAYRKALAAQTQDRPPTGPKPGKAVTLALEELKEKLRERRERFKSLLVEYEMTAEPHVEPRQLASWNMHSIRDYQERHRVAFAGAKRYTQVLRPEVVLFYVPQDQLTPDPNAPADVKQAVERQRKTWAARKQQGSLGHLFARTHAEEIRSVFDGSKCFLWSELSNRLVPTQPDNFYAPLMYLANLGLRPVDPRPGAERAKQQQAFWFPDNFALYESCRVLPNEETVDGAACVVVEGKRRNSRDGKRAVLTDRIWFDPKLGYAPRKWEQREDGRFLGERTNKEFEEFTPGCWLPWEGTWTLGTPAWVGPEWRDRPAYSYHMRLRKARVNDVDNAVFHP